MTTDEQAVIDWLDSLCAQAEERRLHDNDLSFLNRMAANSGIKHYFDNVYKMRSVPREQWMLWYPSQSGAARMAYAAAQAAEAQNARVDALESRLTTIEGMLAELLNRSPKKGK